MDHDISQTPAKNLIDLPDTPSDSIKISSPTLRPDEDQKGTKKISDGIHDVKVQIKVLLCLFLILFSMVVIPIIILIIILGIILGTIFAIIFDLIIKIAYFKYSNGAFLNSIFSKITIIAICFHVFPISLIIYFAITYLVTVWVEFSNFLSMFSGGSLSDSIKKAIQKSDEIILTDQAFSQKYVELFGEEPLQPLFVKLLPKMTVVMYISIVIALIKTDINDALVCISIFTLFFAKLSKGLDLYAVYTAALIVLESSTKLLKSSLGKYDKKTIYQQTLWIRKSTSLVAEICEPYSLIEFSDTVSFLWILFIFLAISLFDIPEISSDLGTGNALLNESPGVQQIGGYMSICLNYLFGSAGLFILKLWAGYKRNSLYEKVENEFNEIKSQFSYISKLPESCISITKDGKEIIPHVNDILQWEDIKMDDIDNIYLEKREEESINLHSEDKRVNDSVEENPVLLISERADKSSLVSKKPDFLNKRKNVEYLLNKIKEDQGLPEVKYSELLILLSKEARKSSERLSLVVEEFQKFFKKAEYKLFGYWAINRALLSKLAVAVGTSIFAYSFSFLAKHYDY